MKGSGLRFAILVGRKYMTYSSEEAIFLQQVTMLLPGPPLVVMNTLKRAVNQCLFSLPLCR